MVFQVLEMGFYSVGAVLDHTVHDFHFVIRLGGARFYLYRVLGAFADACAEAVAEQVADEAGFAVYDLEGSFMAAGNAVPAAVAFSFVYLDDLSFGFHIRSFTVISSISESIRSSMASILWRRRQAPCRWQSFFSKTQSFIFRGPWSTATRSLRRIFSGSRAKAKPPPLPFTA